MWWFSIYRFCRTTITSWLMRSKPFQWLVSFFFQSPRENVPHWPSYLAYRHRENSKWKRRRIKICAFHVSLSLKLSFSLSLLIIMNQFSNSFSFKCYDVEKKRTKERKKLLSTCHWRSFEYVIYKMTSISWECLLND